MNTDNQTKIEHRLTMGKWFATTDQSCELITPSLGSCIAVCLYEPTEKIGAMAHVVIPTRQTPHGIYHQELSQPNARYADEAIDLLIEEIKKLSRRSSPHIVAKLSGGAQMFKGIQQKTTGNPEKAFPMIGQNNYKALNIELSKHKIPLLGSDLGGSTGRTVTFIISSGRVSVRRIGEDKEIFI